MKGLDLPINAVIIIALAVIVLLALVAVFYPTYFSSSNVVEVNSVKSKACNVLNARSCNMDTSEIIIDNFDADKDGNTGAAESGIGWNWAALCPTDPLDGTLGDNLAALCRCYFQIYSERDCKALCSC